MGLGVLAVGVPDVMRAVQQQLRLGATGIKLSAGGVASNYDTFDVTQYTFEEIKAAIACWMELATKPKVMDTTRNSHKVMT